MIYIPYGRQNITHDDIESVVQVLKSDLITQGPVVPAFEKAVSIQVGSDFSVAVNSATSALHLACLSLGLSEQDWLWTTPITFVASANCGLYCGAKIDFVDIDDQTHNMSISALTDKLRKAEALSCLPKIVVVVHFSGESCDMESIHQLAQKYKFKIIEDASHAIGGEYKDAPIGCCRYSDITVFSFHPVKIITTGEGGMATTNQKSLFDRMMMLRSHGITRDSQVMSCERSESWYYEQHFLGFNYRLTDIQAALGLSQLRSLESNIARRHELAERYDTLLEDVPLQIPKRNCHGKSSLHLYVVQLQLNDINVDRAHVFNSMRDQNIGVNVHYIPVHLQPYYRRFGFKKGDFQVAENYYLAALTLPMYPNLKFSDQDRVVSALKLGLGLG